MEAQAIARWDFHWACAVTSAFTHGVQSSRSDRHDWACAATLHTDTRWKRNPSPPHVCSINKAESRGCWRPVQHTKQAERGGRETAGEGDRLWLSGAPEKGAHNRQQRRWIAATVQKTPRFSRPLSPLFHDFQGRKWKSFIISSHDYCASPSIMALQDLFSSTETIFTNSLCLHFCLPFISEI